MLINVNTADLCARPCEAEEKLVNPIAGRIIQPIVVALYYFETEHILESSNNFARRRTTLIPNGVVDNNITVKARTLFLVRAKVRRAENTVGYASGNRI